MSYNPAHKSRNRKSPRRIPPGAGLKHSEIIRRRGGTFAPVGVNREKTLHGFRSPLFKGDTFVTYFEHMYAGNATAMGVNETRDKFIRVVKGSAFLIQGKLEDGEVVHKETSTISEGDNLSLGKGTVYSISTSGTAPVELWVTEDAEYEESWQKLEAAISRDGDLVFIDRSDIKISPRRDRSESKAKEQAAKMSKDKKRGRGRPRKAKADLNANSSSALGVNPRPAGPGGFED